MRDIGAATSLAPDEGGVDALAALTPTQLDRHLRARLAGRHLVCEVTWSRAERERIQLTAPALLRHKRPRDMGAEYPALLVAYLVRIGADRYDGDEGYWGHTCLPQARRNEAGIAFEDALAVLGLETFPHFDQVEGQRPLRFLSRILAHTGVPKTTARKLLDEVIMPTLARNGRMSADELIACLRTRRPAMTRTAARFLFHGGRTAADLLGRTLDALDVPPEELRADGHGLPKHLRDAICETPAASRPRLAAALPRPRLELDPYGGGGPELVLPVLERELYDATTWRLSPVPLDGAAGAAPTDDVGPIIERSGRRFDEERLPLAPTGSWHLEATVEGRTRLDLDFECFAETDIVCFEGMSWGYLRHGSELRAQDVWIIARPDTRLAVSAGGATRPPQVLEAPRPLHGTWAGYKLARYNLSGAHAIIVTGAARTSVVPVATGTTGPCLVGDVVRDASGLAGEPVYSASPTIHVPAGGTWAVTIARLDREGRPIGEPDERIIDATVNDVEIPAIGEPLPFGRYRTIARGAMGTDLRETFVVVPGLVIETPDVPILGVDDIVVPVRSALERSLLGETEAALPGEAMAFPAGDAVQELWAWRDNHDGVGMRVHIPRVRWALRGGDEIAPVPATERLVLDPAVLTLDDTLILEAGRPGIGVELDLVGPDGSLLQAGGEIRHAGRDGVIEIGLARYLDTWRAEPRARLLARLPGGSVTIAAPPMPRSAAVPANGHGEGPDRAATRLRRGACVRGTITKVLRELLLVDLGEGVTGRAFIDHLPRDVASYRVGEEVEGRILVEGAKPKLEMRTFDERAFTSGTSVLGRIREVREREIVVALDSDQDAVVGIAGLPPGRRIADYRAGDAVAGIVIDRDGQAFRWRLTLVDRPPTEFSGARPVSGVVRGTDRGRLVLDLGGAVGTVEARELPDGRPAHRYAPGERVEGWVLNRDDKWRIVWCSLRPFTAKLAPGDKVEGIVERTTRASTLIRTDDGHLAAAPRAHYATTPRVGERVAATVVRVDPRERRLDVSLAGGGPAYVAGDDDGGDLSPFAVLRGLKGRS